MNFLSERDRKIATLRAQGKTHKVIAEEVGVAEATVSKRLKKEEVQEFLDRAQETIIRESLPQSVENINNVIGTYLYTNDLQMRDHGFKASIKVLESVGILPSNNQSVVITNITQNNLISPFMKELITRHFGLPQPQENVVEAEEVKDARKD